MGFSWWKSRPISWRGKSGFAPRAKLRTTTKASLASVNETELSKEAAPI
jgi:hypothetical protein